MYIRKKQSGFLLLEVVVASSVVGLVLVLILGSIQNSVRVSERSLQVTRAAFLLEEGAEAIKTIRDRGWSNISSLNTNTTYYLSWNGTDWSLVTIPNVFDSFTRSVSIESVNRDSTSDDIVLSGGVIDSGTKKFTITVSWSGQTGTVSESLPFYITDLSQ